MRKALGIIPALILLAALGAPNALADTLFTYTLTYTPMPGSTFTFTTVALNPAVALGTPQTGITSDSFTGFYAGTALVLYELRGFNSTVPLANLLIQVTGGPSLGPPETFFSPSDYTNAGTYNGVCEYNCFNGPTPTLTVTAVQTPEPSTGGLMLFGIGFVLVMRKRIAQGLPQAT